MVGGGKEEGREWKGGTYRVGIGYAGGFAVFDDARAVPEAEEEGGRGGEEDIASGRVSVEDKNTQESRRHVFWSRGERKGMARTYPYSGATVMVAIARFAELFG